MRYSEFSEGEVVGFPEQPLPGPLKGFADLLSDPRPTHALYQQGDMLMLGDEMGEVVKSNEKSLLIRFPSGDRVVSRRDPNLTVAPFERWGDNLTEAFDSVQPYQWTHWEDETAQEVMADFQIGDGHFKVMFKEKAYERGIWELSFYRNGTLDLTGTGSAATVLSTVMQITRDFISTQDPRYIGYAAKNEEGSRNKLYPKLMAKLMKEFPQYTAHPPKKRRTYTSYDLERPAKAYVPPAPEPQPEQEPAKPLSAEEWDDLEAFMNEFEAEHRNRR